MSRHRENNYKYLKINNEYNNDLYYKILKYGFCSMVNSTLNAIFFGLQERRRLIIDQTALPGGWSTYFNAHIPDGVLPDIGTYREEIELWGLIGWIIDLSKEDRPVSIPALDLHGDLFSIMRRLAAIFCDRSLPSMPGTWRPARAIQAELGLEDGGYLACHVRQGDKIMGTPILGPDGGWSTHVEGEYIPVSHYIRRARKIAPDIKKIFVMTDDYAVIEEFRSQAKGFSIHTFCRSTDVGYHQNEFDRKSSDDQQAALLRFMEEVDVATNSQVFLGCYLSNVSRFIVLRHREPEVCHSLDRIKRWMP